jgi:hypothetical protein
MMLFGMILNYGKHTPRNPAKQSRGKVSPKPAVQERGIFP